MSRIILLLIVLINASVFGWKLNVDTLKINKLGNQNKVLNTRGDSIVDTTGILWDPSGMTVFPSRIHISPNEPTFRHIGVNTENSDYDTSSFSIAGSNSATIDRAGFITLYGNDHDSGGDVEITAGYTGVIKLISNPGVDFDFGNGRAFKILTSTGNGVDIGCYAGNDTLHIYSGSNSNGLTLYENKVSIEDTLLTNIVMPISGDTVFFKQDLKIDSNLTVTGYTNLGTKYISSDGSTVTGAYFLSDNTMVLRSQARTTGRLRYVLLLTDTTQYAEGMGSGIAFTGRVNSTSTVVYPFGGIMGVKANSTEGNAAGNVMITVRSDVATRIATIIDKDRNMVDSGNITATGELYSSGEPVSVQDQINGKTDTTWKTDVGLANPMIYRNEDFGIGNHFLDPSSTISQGPWYNLFTAAAFFFVKKFGGASKIVFYQDDPILTADVTAHSIYQGSNCLVIAHSDTGGVHDGSLSIDTVIARFKKDSLIVNGYIKSKNDTVATAACTLYDGATNRATGTLIYTKSGQNVTVQFPYMTGTITAGNTALICHAGLQFAAPYANSSSDACIIQNNGANQAGKILQDMNLGYTFLLPLSSWTTGTGGLPDNTTFTYIAAN